MSSGQGFRSPLAIGRRLLMAFLLAVVIVGISGTGFLMGTLPRPFAVAFEPLCLLMMPGIVPALLVAGSHDFSPDAVLGFAMAFYTLVGFWWLGRGRPRVPLADDSPAHHTTR